ncbi:MAG: hypothetical protein H0W02_08710 [Ktedonobacteraceae bacterium]|nr:hypothetical protein [Ktedonobacteraceae bacterium]
MQNLWADLDNEQPPPAPGGHGRARRLTEPVILSSLRDWLLHDYVATYCRSLTASPLYRRCYWVDALGSGTKTQSDTDAVAPPAEVQGVAKKGRKKEAPLVPAALRPLTALGQTLAQEGRSIALYGIVLEAGSSRRKDARTPKEGLAISREGGVVRASWLEAGPLVLQTLDQAPAIFLLNPFGQSLFTYDDLNLLYQRMAPTELCLLIPHKQVEARLLAAQHTPDATTALVALLRSDRWKALIPKDQDAPALAHAVDGIIDLLIDSIRRQFLAVQRISISMQVRPAVVETAPYSLVFATRRQDSLASMNDAACLYRRRLYERSHQGVLGEAWFVTQQQEHLAEALEYLHQRALHLGRTRNVRRWPDLRQQLLLANFGQFTTDDYNEVIRTLFRAGEVRCEWRRPPTTEEGDPQEFPLPGNDDILLW